MKVIEVENALDLLCKYNSEIRHKLVSLKEVFDYCSRHPEKFESDEVKNELRAMLENINNMLYLLQSEESVESLLAGVDEEISNIIKDDIQELERISNKIKEFIMSLIQSELAFSPSASRFRIKEGDALAYVKKINDFAKELEKILSRDIYSEQLMKEIIDFVKSEWERNIKDKYAWLYHGTSVLLLPHIQQNGLDSSKLPSGIKRAIETVSNLFVKYGSIRSVGQIDIDPDMSKKGISFAIREESAGDIRNAASASSLPAFMYELLNEEHLMKIDYLAEKIEKFNPEEQRLFKIIMRFGKILRAKNKVVLLHVKLDSKFITSLGFPDFISDFNVFFSEYFVKRMNFNELMRDINSRKDGAAYCCRNIFAPIMYFYDINPKLGVRDLSGLRIRNKPILPQFIFLEVKTGAGYSLINISDWNETMEPKFV